MFEFCSVTITLATTLVVTTLMYIIYVLMIKHWNFFTERNIVFERGLPVVGTFFGDIQVLLKKKSVAESVQDVYNRHSNRKFIGMYDIGGVPSYMIKDPELINRITIKDFDYFVNHFFQLDTSLDPLLGRALFSMANQPWRDMRNTLSPLFTGSKMRHMLVLLNECSKDFNEYIRQDILSKSATNGVEYDMSDLMMRLTNDGIGSTAFGIQINTLKDPEHEFFKMGKDIAYAIMSFKAFFNLAFPKIASFFKLKVVSDRHDKFFRDVIHNTIEERRQKKIVRNDILNLLLLTKEGKLSEEDEKEVDQDTGYATVSEYLNAKQTEKIKNWTDDDLVAQCILFFLAGLTGAATTVCFACYELATNVDVQQRLYEEIIETNEQLNGKPLTFESLQKMKYLDMTVTEVLRKWPIGNTMDRCVNKQYLLEDSDGTNALLQPNDVLWIPTFAIHRDPKYYPNPEVFHPERFSDENKKNIQPYTYIPFGIGPRACIGNRFALLQVKTVLYHLLLDFKIECGPKTQIPIKIGGAANVISARDGFFNRLVPRK